MGVLEGSILIDMSSENLKSHRTGRLIGMRSFWLIILGLWSLLNLGALLLQLKHGQQYIEQLAAREARSHFDMDLALRKWAASHGGVYVPANDRTPPSPYLSHIPERDLTTPSGKKLTLMNPAYILRQLMQDYADEYGIRGHITSLKPIRPQNAADAWEELALLQFESGVREVSEKTEINGKMYLRLMKPMVVEKGCLKCHAHQGYLEGDIRGGVGVSVPLRPYEEMQKFQRFEAVTLFGLLWAVGFAGIAVTAVLSRRREAARLAMEERMEQLAARNQTILESAGEGILELDTAGDCMFVNPAACRLLGFEPEEMVGKNGHSVWHGSRLSGEPYPVEECPIHNAPLLKKAHAGEEDFMRKDGSFLRVLYECVPIMESGRATGTVLSFLDITAQKAAEQSLRENERILTRAQQVAKIGVWTMDLASKKMTWSDEMCAIHGLPGHVPDMDEYIQTCIHPDDRANVEERAKTIRSSSKRHSIEYRIVRPDGQERNVWSEPAGEDHDAGGRVVRLHGIVQDITDRRNLEEEIRRTQQMESLGVLAGGIAHDFNNLLGGIFGYIDLARNSSPGIKAGEFLNRAVDTFERARDLTRQLLTFARGGAPSRSTGSLAPVIEQSAHFAVSGSSAECRFEIADDLWLCDFDKNQIGQVIDNLIINANQAMPSGGTILVSAVNVRVETGEYVYLKAGRYVRISVRDTGGGVDPKILPRIFEPFFTTKERGTGLGLAIAYSIVKKHEGEIRVDSTAGKGSTFHVYLPASDGQTTQLEAAAKPVFRGSGSILVMDDEEYIRDTAGAMLNAMGFDTAFASDGREALLRIEQARNSGKPFRAVLMDLTIRGGMGGKEAIEEFRKTDKTTVAIVLSGYSEDPVLADPAAYGFTASLSKPFRPADLEELMSRLLPA